MVKTFHSALSPYFASFVHEKHACGYRYVAETAELRRFDRFLSEHACPAGSLSRSLVEQWTAKRPHNRPRTHRSRVTLIRQFTRYLCSRGVTAYVLDSNLKSIVKLDYVPHIYTHQQIRLLFGAVDSLPFDPRTPERQVIMPELFRVLYACGLRAGEALRLRFGDVDLDRGVLTIREGKFRKDRLVPMAAPLTIRLRSYAARMKFRAAEAVFFPNPKGSSYDLRSIYSLFRRILRNSGIPHGGRGKGPRLHDLRHTFAVHCLERWYRRGDDLNARLPLLVTYLGHRSLRGTQRYLQLTPAIFPDINARLESLFHHTTPKKVNS